MTHPRPRQQLADLQAPTTDKPETQRELRVGTNRSASVALTLRGHDVILLTLQSV